jgi:hypothetical protein
MRGSIHETLCVIVLTAMLAFAASGQWINYPTRGIPRTKHGKPSLTARAPHTPEGKPDLSGIWHGESAKGDAPQGTDGDALPKYFLDITRDLAPADIPFQPWAADLYNQRRENFGKDDPISRCLPLGVPRSDADGVPMKIIQTQDVVAILQEGDASFRQVFLDGRPLPRDPQPSWRGYSVGKFQGGVLVVETRGFRDRVGWTVSVILTLMRSEWWNGSSGAISGTWILKSPSTIPKHTGNLSPIPRASS